jgi:catechol 2,3-dioxygenase-like lactoylglutathione lyase family enzyme
MQTNSNINNINIEGSATIFVVRDLPRSIAFYRDSLGFTVAFTYGEPPMYAGVERGELLIHLQAAAHTKRQPGHAAFYAFVDDLDALFEEFKTKGVELPNAPKDYPYGMRDFYFFDPDGNQLSFGMQAKKK